MSVAAKKLIDGENTIAKRFPRRTEAIFGTTMIGVNSHFVK